MYDEFVLVRCLIRDEREQCWSRGQKMTHVASQLAHILHPTLFIQKDLAPYNIRVNAVSPALIGPGFMWTRQNELHAKSGSPYFASDPEIVAQNKISKYVYVVDLI